MHAIALAGTLVAVLVVVGLPTTSAMLPPADGSPGIPVLDAGSSRDPEALMGAGADLDTSQEVDDAVQGSDQAAQEVTECRDAVRVTLVWFGGTVEERRDGGLDVLVDRLVPTHVLNRVPAHQFATQLLGGLLSTANRAVGYSIVGEAVPENVALAVHARWTEERISWERFEVTYNLTLPAGAPHLVQGDGVLAKVCDPEAPILNADPSVDQSGYDYVVLSLADEAPRDGWYVRILSVRVDLATPDEIDSLPLDDTEGFSACPLDVVNAIEAQARQVKRFIYPADEIAPPQPESIQSPAAFPQTGAPGLEVDPRATAADPDVFDAAARPSVAVGGGVETAEHTLLASPAAQATPEPASRVTAGPGAALAAVAAAGVGGTGLLAFLRRLRR